MYKKTVLKNGLRIITVPMKNTRAVTVLVLVGTGSKYETKEINGISHFLEHMFGQGTSKRPNHQKIAETLDKVGGSWNFFTSKEFTGFWAKTRNVHLDLALDWVSDILLNSKFEPSKIKKEKGVIVEEINMYLDTPTRYIGDLWEELLYGDQPAGWHILGRKEIIQRLQRRDLLNYLRNHYSTLNTVVCVAGNFNQIECLRKIKKFFKKLCSLLPQPKVEVIEKQSKPQVLIHFKKTDQTHLCLGARGYDLFHPRRYAQEILATILGGNASARIHVLLREKGWAYYVYTSSEVYTDSGYIVTGAGVPNNKIEEVIKSTLKEYRKIKEKKVSLKELKKAKEYLKGSLALSLETSDARASFYAGQELLTGKILTPEEKFAKIDEVTPTAIQKLAQDIFRPEKLNLALIGPHKNQKKFQALLKI